MSLVKTLTGFQNIKKKNSQLFRIHLAIKKISNKERNGGIATFQGRAKQSCQPGVVLLSEKYHTSPPPHHHVCLYNSELFNTMSNVIYDVV